MASFLVAIAVLIGLDINYQSHRSYSYALKQINLTIRQINLPSSYKYVTSSCVSGGGGIEFGEANGSSCTISVYVFESGSGNQKVDQQNLQNSIINAGLLSVPDTASEGSYYKPKPFSIGLQLISLVGNFSNDYHIPNSNYTKINNIMPYPVGYIISAGYSD